MLESKIKINEHIIVTPPDRFFNDALCIFLLDWPADLLDQAFNAVSGSSIKLAIHVANYNDNDYKWIMDVANQADLIAINFNNINTIDVFKGHLISKTNVFYFGRPDLQSLFHNHTNDPIGTLLVKVGNLISQMEEK